MDAKYTSYDRLVNNSKRSFGEMFSRASLGDVLRVARRATARCVYQPRWAFAGGLLKINRQCSISRWHTAYPQFGGLGRCMSGGRYSMSLLTVLDLHGRFIDLGEVLVIGGVLQRDCNHLHQIKASVQLGRQQKVPKKPLQHLELTGMRN